MTRANNLSSATHLELIKRAVIGSTRLGLYLISRERKTYRVSGMSARNIVIRNYSGCLCDIWRYLSIDWSFSIQEVFFRCVGWMIVCIQGLQVFSLSMVGRLQLVGELVTRIYQTVYTHLYIVGGFPRRVVRVDRNIDGA